MSVWNASRGFNYLIHNVFVKIQSTTDLLMDIVQEFVTRDVKFATKKERSIVLKISV